jgi:hypothetical protein
MHVKEDTCTDGVHPSYYFRLRAVRAYSALSLIHRRSKVTSIQSRGIGFSKPILCIRKFWSFCASCSHPRWKKSITLPFLCKILDCSGYTHICLGEADACSCGQENDQPNVALLLASVVRSAAGSHGFQILFKSPRARLSMLARRMHNLKRR